VSTLIANNLVLGKQSPMIKYVDKKQPGITYRKNIMYGTELGIDVPVGIVIQDPKLIKGPDGLWRPAVDSPAISTARVDIGMDVSTDIDGQTRARNRSIGADEPSKEPLKIRPLTHKDVGPKWKSNT